MATVEERILAALREHPGTLGPSELADIADTTVGTVHQSLAALLKSGDVVRPYHGRYTTPKEEAPEGGAPLVHGEPGEAMRYEPPATAGTGPPSPEVIRWVLAYLAEFMPATQVQLAQGRETSRTILVGAQTGVPSRQELVGAD